MKTYIITITDGKSRDRFSLKARCRSEAERIARIAHIGSGWNVENVSTAPTERRINF